MANLLPIASKDSQKWWDIFAKFPIDLTDVVFDTGSVIISGVKRLDPDSFAAISTVINLTKLQEMLIHGSDLTHVLAFPGRIVGILKADDSLKMVQALIGLTRTISAIAKMLFESSVIVFPQGQMIAGRVKYISWSLSGAITIGEKLYAFYDPTEEQKQYGTIILIVDLVKSTVFLGLGGLRLFDRPQLRLYILPTSALLLVLASTVYIAQKSIKAYSVKPGICEKCGNKISI